MQRQQQARLTTALRSARRLLSVWRRRDPAPWIVALLGVAMGAALFLIPVLLLLIQQAVRYVMR